MSLEELKRSEETILVPEDVAEVLKCNPQAIREQARANPLALGFPVIMVGGRAKIPRIPFLRFLGV